MKSDQIKDYPRDIDAELESMWFRVKSSLDEPSTQTKIQALEKKMQDAEKVLTETKSKVSKVMEGLKRNGKQLLGLFGGDDGV